MKKPNLLFFGIDSLRADHMSLHGYHRLTTPHIDRYLQKDSVVFERCFSPSIPTTPGYASMLTGMDCFSTDIVALRHIGDFAPGRTTLAELLRDQGYSTTCIGFSGNIASRGFERYLNYEGWSAGHDDRAHKAENLNAVAIPEMARLAAGEQPFFLFLRHMDPHSPYLPPEPFHKIFYQGDEFDPANRSLDPVYQFKPFCDYFRSWFPAGCTDKDYIIAQYDAEVAYMDTCIQSILEKLADLGLEEETVVVFTADHGETLYDHDCYFDHHGMYECTLTVPFAIRYAGQLKGRRIADYCQLKDLMPTLLDLMGIESQIAFDGRDLMPAVRGGALAQEEEMYITECTWQRKHGWRTPQWKVMEAFEPDFHFKPKIELYDLIKDPQELHNVAPENPETVAYLLDRMNRHIARRTAATGRTNPMETNLNWHGAGCGPFKTSEQAYNTLHIGDPAAARKLQADRAKDAKS
jgi:arylsulfatase A-like enzyme